MNRNFVREGRRCARPWAAAGVVVAAVGATVWNLGSEPAWPGIRVGASPVRQGTVVRHIAHIRVEGLATAERLVVTAPDPRVRVAEPSRFRGLPAGTEVRVLVDVPLCVASWDLEAELIVGAASSRRRLRFGTGGAR